MFVVTVVCVVSDSQFTENGKGAIGVERGGKAISSIIVIEDQLEVEELTKEETLSRQLEATRAALADMKRRLGVLEQTTSSCLPLQHPPSTQDKNDDPNQLVLNVRGRLFPTSRNEIARSNAGSLLHTNFCGRHDNQLNEVHTFFIDRDQSQHHWLYCHWPCCHWLLLQ